MHRRLRAFRRCWRASMILGQQEYELLIFQLLSLLSESFGILIAIAGLAWSLMWLRDAGLSARLSAIAFGLQLAMQIGEVIRSYLALDGWTFYTPYSTEASPSFWSNVAWLAISVLSWMTSATLLLAALVIAWRRQHAARQTS